MMVTCEKVRHLWTNLQPQGRLSESVLLTEPHFPAPELQHPLPIVWEAREYPLLLHLRCQTQ